MPSRSFYSLMIDFITDLSFKDGHDMIIIVVNRFSKRVTFKTEKRLSRLRNRLNVSKITSFIREAMAYLIY